VGTSSAVPDDLDAWAGASRQLDDPLTTRKSTLDRLHGEFTGSLGWGSFDASSLLAGFGSWLGWNETDAKWVETIAQAFRDAGTHTLPDATLDAAITAAHLDTPRVSVTYDDPVALGEPPTSGYTNDPVNTATGNFVEVETDLVANGLVRLVRFVRTYNSRSGRVGPFGPGWASWASARLRALEDGAHWESPDGQRVVVPRAAGSHRANGNGNGSAAVRYERVVGLSGLVVPAGEGLAVDWFHGGRLTFDTAGRPLVADGGPGTEVRFTHDGDRLVAITHGSGLAVELVWDGDRISEARSSDGRQVGYLYDDRRRLIEAGARRYEWDEHDRLVAVTDADGVVAARNRYDADGRVLSQLSPHGRRSRLRYLPGRVTLVDDDAGGPTNAFVHDDRGRLVGVIDGHGTEMAKAYDRWGNPTAVTERDGTVTRQEWDDRERLVRRVGPDGVPAAFAWDEHDRLVEVAVGEGGDAAVTRYRYQGRERIPVEIVDPEGGVTRLAAEGGLLRAATDPDGVEIRFAYDARGNVVAATDGLGNTATVERDGAGRPVATVSPGGLRTALVYDDRGRVVERRDPGGGVTRFEWSPAGRLLAVVDPVGARTEIRPGAHGDAEAVVDPLGHVTTRRYDMLGNLVGVEMPGGAKWELAYDGLCRLVGVTDPAGGAWLREYDAAGHLVGTVDPVGTHRTATVDAAGRITGVDDGLAAVGYGYDALGRVAVRRRPDGGELRATRDRCGRITAVADPAGRVTRYGYTPGGRLAATVSPMGLVSRYEHDRAGRRVAAVDPDGGRWTYRHDADGRVTQVVAPGGEAVRLRYDAAGRLAARVAPAGGTTRWDYDAAGRPVAVTAAGGGVSRYRWDLRDRLVEVVDANGGATRYERDETGAVRTLVDPLGGRVEMRYDALGRLAARSDQLGRTTEWEYDAAGQVVRRRLPTGGSLRWWRDGSGRVRAIGAGDAATVAVERDAVGRVVGVTEPGFRHELAWDDADRLVAQRRNGVGLAWRYDDDGRRTAVVLPDGREVGYEHDPLGRAVAATHPALGRVAVEHDAAGRVVARVSAAGREAWTWRDGLLVGHEVTAADGTTRAVAIERDAAGRAVAVTAGGVRRTYGYDAGGMLVADGDRTLRYDAAGRLVAEAGPGGDVAYRYDAAHQLAARADGAGETTYEHDAAGRRVGERRPDGTTRTLAWDAQGRLAAVGDTPVAVDALGDLAEVGGRPLLWDPVGAAAPQLRWYDGAAIVGGSEPWAQVADGADDAAWLLAGWQGTPGATGPLDAWGAGVGGDLGLGYRGELTVDGLVWLRHRAYDPAARGFVSPDPLPGVPGDPFSAHPYHYAGNDPLGSLDPLGLRPLSESELADFRRAASRNLWDRSVDWVGDNWEYIAAGALIVGGVLVMATGVGGPIGAAMIGGALLSGGFSAGSQKLMTGHVDWGQVGIDMAIGAAAGGTGAALTSSTTVARVATTTVGRGMIAGAGEGFVSGMAYEGVDYARTGEFNPADVARSTLLGGGMGGGGAWLKERNVLGPLRRTGPDTFESRNTGLTYGPDPRFGNRVNHVLNHTVDDPNRMVHGVFSGDRNVFDQVDDAYTRSQSATTGVVREPTQMTNHGPLDVSTSTGGRPVGFVGGSGGAAAGNPSTGYVRNVIRNGNEVITSYPVAGIPMP
jgi:RHS repeat-associated protein